MRNSRRRSIAVVDAVNNWCLGKDGNSLYKCNIERGELEFETMIDDQRNNGQLYGCMWQEEDVLYCFPIHANNITAYNILTRQKQQFVIPYEFNEKPKISNAFIYNGIAWLIPFCVVDFIIVFDLNAHLFRKIHIKFPNDNWKFHEQFWGLGMQIENEFWVPCQQENFILHGGENFCEICQIDFYGVHGFFDMAYDGRKFWLIPVYGNYLLGWDPSNQKIQPFKLDGEGIEKLPYVAVEYVNHQIWLIPFHAKSFLALDCETNRKIAYKIPKELERIVEEDYNLFLKVVVSNHSIYLYPWKLSIIIEIDTDSREIKRQSEFNIYTDMQPKEKLFFEAGVGSEWYQDGFVQLKNIMKKGVVDQKWSLESENQKTNTGGYGGKIYKYIKGESLL